VLPGVQFPVTQLSKNNTPPIGTDSAHQRANQERPKRHASTSRWRFLAAASVIIWLAAAAPLAILTSWLFDRSLPAFLTGSLLVAPLLTLWMWLSVQSANTALKWPAVQLIGTTTILLCVVVFCSPLLWFVDRVSTGIIALLLWLAACVYAVFRAINIEDKQLKLSATNITRKHRFVQISDVHVGSRSKKFLQRVVDRVNEHQPDGLLITGDLLDASSVTVDDLRPLSNLRCPSWMCLGNHERYVNLAAAIAAVEANGVEVLRNRAINFLDVSIIGIDDADDPRQLALNLPDIKWPSERYSILLYHRPSGWDDALAHNVDLMLSGHTHGGQIWPFGLLVKLQFRRMLGLFSQGNSHLYVSPGTGTWGPTMRLGTHSEMTIIDIEAGNTG